MEALARIPTETWTIELTEHCVEQYRERFCPALDIEVAEDRLERLLDHARLEPDPPHWVVPMPGPPAAAYLVVADDLALPLVERVSSPDVLFALTCLPRGGITHAARARRNRARARHRRRHGQHRRPLADADGSWERPGG